MTCIVLLYQISTKLSGPQYELYQGPPKLIDIYKLSLNHLARRHRCECTLFRPGIVSHRHQQTRCCKLIGTQHILCRQVRCTRARRCYAGKIEQNRILFRPGNTLTLPTAKAGGFSVQPPQPAPARSYTVSPSV